jgi:polar amino acid transport system substrate-binding protein
MNARLSLVAAVLATLPVATLAAALPEIVFIAPTNHTMPLAQFVDGKLVDGILKDLGDTIAKRLGRQARFVSVPSKRVGPELARGAADSVCYVMPDWIDGDFNWTLPLVPNGLVLIAQANAPVVRTLADLKGKRVGTVLGYRYVMLDAALGAQFIRDDAPSIEHLLGKFGVARTPYALVEQATLTYKARTDPAFRARADLTIATFKARCAFSRMSKIPFADVERVAGAIARDGHIDAIMARYR